MPTGWGSGTQINQSAKGFREYQTLSNGNSRFRTVTDATELWVGMDETNADNKKTALDADPTYTDVQKNFVGGGQFQVSGVKRSYGAWGAWAY